MELMRRSTAAFLIALLLHVVLIILFIFLGSLTSELKPKAKKQEQRIKVSLKENPKAKKESLEKNKIKEPELAPPMPKGEQLKKLVEKPFVKPAEKPIKPKPINKPKPQPKPKPKPEKTAPLPPKKPYIPVKKPKPIEKPKEPVEVNTTKAPKKEHNKLYSFLSQEVEPEKKAKESHTPTKRESRVSQDIKEAYGDTFGELSEGEQKYILDNQEIMRRITQQVLNRVGGVNLPNNLRVNEHNIVEFYLYPNGDISDIKFVERSGFYILDDTTKETIEYAYSRYPRPDQKTLIRYRVGYYLRGY
ncbi:MAG: energy transducer TonB [Campylobacterota bacterium]|nr:energy transducer TonB [Campylobacterota bacterium]